MDIKLSNVVVPLAKKYFYTTYASKYANTQDFQEPYPYHRMGLNLEVQGLT